MDTIGAGLRLNIETPYASPAANASCGSVNSPAPSAPEGVSVSASSVSAASTDAFVPSTTGAEAAPAPAEPAPAEPSPLNEPESAPAGGSTRLSVLGQRLEQTDSNINLSGISDALSGTEFALNGLEAIGESTGVAASCIALGGALGYGMLGCLTTTLGAAQITGGIKDKDPEKVLEGTGNTLGGLSNIATSGAMASTLKAVPGALGPILSTVATPLALASASVDIGLGIKDIVTGIKEKSVSDIVQGALSSALGVAVMVSGIVGGVPALAACAALLTANVVVGRIADRQEARQALQAQQNQQGQQSPNPLPTPAANPLPEEHPAEAG